MCRSSMSLAALRLSRTMSQQFYGWYDDPTQAMERPTYDPPHDAPCLYCGSSMTPADIRTHSLMYAGQYAARSYFYRTHRTCHDKDIAATGLHTGKDGSIFDMIALNGD